MLYGFFPFITKKQKKKKAIFSNITPILHVCIYQAKTHLHHFHAKTLFVKGIKK